MFGRIFYSFEYDIFYIYNKDHSYFKNYVIKIVTYLVNLVMNDEKHV